jgi:hypothetical protein
VESCDKDKWNFEINGDKQQFGAMPNESLHAFAMTFATINCSWNFYRSVTCDRESNGNFKQGKNGKI